MRLTRFGLGISSRVRCLWSTDRDYRKSQIENSKLTVLYKIKQQLGKYLFIEEDYNLIDSLILSFNYEKKWGVWFVDEQSFAVQCSSMPGNAELREEPYDKHDHGGLSNTLANATPRTITKW